MRIRQDLCIALVLAVIGAGIGTPRLQRTPEEIPPALEDAIAARGLSVEDVERVRHLIVRARERGWAGDEDGAALALAEASALLGIG